MQGILDAYLEMQPVTRAYTTACVLTTFLVQLEIVTPFNLYFNWQLIAYEFQWWRLITSFCYFGSVGFTFFFNIIFTYRHCSMLEEGSFRGRTADFVFMFLFGAVFMIISACFVHLIFLSHAFTIMLVYVWSRRNPMIGMNFFGLLSFNAPYLPWVLLLFSLLLGNNAMVDVFGIACGHMYYFLEDVFPNQPNGFRVLETPTVLKWLFDPAPIPHVDVHERPGGYNWGNTEDQRADDGAAEALPAAAGAMVADGDGVQPPAEDEEAEAILISDAAASSSASHSGGGTSSTLFGADDSDIRQRHVVADDDVGKSSLGQTAVDND